jgi:hypothetical protein
MRKDQNRIKLPHVFMHVLAAVMVTWPCLLAHANSSCA